MRFSESIFAARFNITRGDLEGYLSEALSQGGDYADLYFEYLLTSSIGIDESMVESATQGVSMGVGVRVIAGARTPRGRNRTRGETVGAGAVGPWRSSPGMCTIGY